MQNAAQGAAHLYFFLPQFAAFSPGKHQGIPAGKGHCIAAGCRSVHAQQKGQIVAGQAKAQHAP